MKKTISILSALLLTSSISTIHSQNIDLNNSTDYIRIQKVGESGFSRAFGLNGSNHLYIGSVEKSIGNIYFFNKGVNHLMTLGSNGNVGIGTTNPSTRLDILSNVGQTESFIRFKVADAPSDYLQIFNATGTENQFIPSIKGHHESDNRSSIYLTGSTSDSNDTGGHAIMSFNVRRTNSTIQNRPLFVWENYTTKMMTMTANGNLGIGTIVPSSKLEVRGSIKASYNTDRAISLFTSGDGNSYMNMIGGSSGSRFGFQVNGSSKMSIMENGNIGIGTTTPDSKLAVNGKIHAQEVKVDLVGWPDYVFENNYSLPTLQEVEQHIIKNGHLQNIPSAAEVEKNGIQLGEMNKKLLEKIEELTLYTIVQEKEIQKIKNDNEELRKLIKDLNGLQDRIEKLETNR